MRVWERWRKECEKLRSEMCREEVRDWSFEMGGGEGEGEGHGGEVEWRWFCHFV